MDTYIQQQWYELVSFLGTVMGDTAEILLEVPSAGVIAASNSGLLGHHVGDPISVQTETLIKQGCAAERSFFICNGHHPRTGQPLRRCYYFLKDEKNELMAVLTITQDLSGYQAVIDSLSQLMGKMMPMTPQTPEISVRKEEKRGAVSSALVEMGLSHVEPHRLTEVEVVELIRLLYQHGVFEARGAVAEIASQLGVSESTVYRHLTAVTRHQKLERKVPPRSAKPPKNP